MNDMPGYLIPVVGCACIYLACGVIIAFVSDWLDGQDKPLRERCVGVALFVFAWPLIIYAMWNLVTVGRAFPFLARNDEACEHGKLAHEPCSVCDAE